MKQKDFAGRRCCDTGGGDDVVRGVRGGCGRRRGFRHRHTGVTVTATKRSTSLQQTPVAITALNAAALDNAHV